MCDKTFNRLDNKYAHIRSKHLNPTIRSSVGFFKFNCSEPISRKVGRTIYHCHVEECSYSSHDKQQLDNHIRAKHTPKPGPKIYRCSGDGCTKKFDRKYRYDRHIKNCKYYICSQPRMVAILSAGKLILLPWYLISLSICLSLCLSKYTIRSIVCDASYQSINQSIYLSIYLSTGWVRKKWDLKNNGYN